MRSRLAVVLIMAGGLVFSLIFARQLLRSKGIERAEWLDKPLRVLTYGSFVSGHGPAGFIFKKFEVEHHVKLDVVISQDPGLLLERLKVGGPFDLVLGLDQTSVTRARGEFAWRALAVDVTGWFEAPAAATDQNFVAFDWSPLTFVYRHDGDPVPATFSELTDPRFKNQFTVPDPRATPLGRQFANWVASHAGARDWLTEFKANVRTIAPSWTAAYGIFERKQTRFVWTYLTSLAFHWGTAGAREFRALTFKEGHPAHVDLAAIPRDCRECALGEKLLRAFLADDAQTLIMKRNYMMPVRRGNEVGTVFAELPQVSVTPLPDKAHGLKEWNEVFTR